MQHYGGPPVHRAHVHEAVAFSGSTTQAQGSRSGRELPQEIVEVIVVGHAGAGHRRDFQEDTRQGSAGDLRL